MKRNYCGKHNRIFLNIIIFILLYTYNSGIIYAHNIDMPAVNHNIITSFYMNTLSLLSYVNHMRPFSNYDDRQILGVPVRNARFNKGEGIYYNSIPFYFDGRARWSGQEYPRMNTESTINAKEDILGDGQFSISTGSLIRLNDYFAIPIFFSGAGGKINDNSEEQEKSASFKSFYTGGGLVFSFEYGTLGAFAGYYNYKTKYKAKGDDFLYDRNLTDIKYGIIPVLDTTRYPSLNYILKAIQAYLCFDFEESKLDYSTKVISRDIPIIPVIGTIYYFYNDYSISPGARSRGHGGGVSSKPLFGSREYPAIFEYEIGYQKVCENIRGALRYSDAETNVYKLSHSFFLGMKMDFIAAGVILRFGNDYIGNSFSIIFSSFFLGFGQSSDSIFFRYRQIHEKGKS